MKRLATVVVILLLLLGFTGAVWALFSFLDLSQIATTESETDQPGSDSASENARSQMRALEEQIAESSHQNSGAVFDVARIDPEGTSVFAGRAKPGDSVTIVADGEAIGTTEADENGEWTVALEHHFANAEPELSLRTGPAAPKAEPKVAQAEATSEASETPAAKAPAKGRSASEVTSRLLKNLEGMVESARVEESQKSAAAASEPPPAPGTEAPAAAGSEAPSPAGSETPSSAGSETPAAAASSEPPAAAGPTTPEKRTASELPAATEAPTAAPSALPESRPERSKMAALDTAPKARSAIDDMPAAESKSVPVPVTFVFNEASFTDEGRKAAALLLEYLKLKHYDRVTLTGHADERGTDELNMELSRERLDTVARFLKEGGYEGRLNLVAKGESEPFTGVVRSEYNQEDLWQLDRRVELIISN